MKKYIIGLLLLSMIFASVGTASAFVFQPGPFGAKFTGVAFAVTAPGQNVPTGNVWGIVSLTGVYSLLDGNPENQNLAGLPYFTPGSDGFNYFGVFGGLAVIGTVGSTAYLGAAPGIAPYLNIYQVPVADTIGGVSPYDNAVSAGPNPGGLGTPGTFGTAITTAPGASLFLQLAPAMGDYMFTYGISPFTGTDESFTITGTTTGHTLAYWDVVGGSGAAMIQTESFPFIPNTYWNLPRINDADADLKIVTDLTTEVSPFGWTTSVEDPITGVFITPCTTDTDCNDSDICTTDTCNLTTNTCSHTPTVPPQCNSSDICVIDGCVNNACTHTPTIPPQCNDNIACTTDTCSNNQCVHTPNNSLCTPQDACHTVQCTLTGCVQTPIAGCCLTAGDCNDNDVCTTDACVNNQCVNTPIANCCTTGSQCNDNNACTADACVNNQCQHTPISNCCTTDSQCNDNNVCTTDVCNLITHTCTNTPIPGCGAQGCTPGFWKANADNRSAIAWTAPYTPTTLVKNVFTGITTSCCSSLGNLTLRQALDLSSGNTTCDAAGKLLSQATAAVLDAASPGISYPFNDSPANIISAVNAALATCNRDTILHLKDVLDADNNLGCPLNNSN